MQKILFVCDDNTVCSPMAEVVATEVFEGLKLDALVFSAGVDAQLGRPASAAAARAVAARGLSLEGHRTRRVDLPLLAYATDVLVMTPAIVDSLERAPLDHRIRVTGLWTFADPGLRLASIAAPSDDTDADAAPAEAAAHRDGARGGRDDYGTLRELLRTTITRWAAATFREDPWSGRVARRRPRVAAPV